MSHRIVTVSGVLAMSCLAPPLCGDATPPPAASRDAVPASQPSRLDEEVFRRGLRERGLFELLDLHDREHPPRDDVSRALRHRESLLRESDDLGRSPSERAESCRKATRVLEGLVATHRDDPRQFAWRLEIGRDLVERQPASAVEAMLFRVASAKERDEVAATASQAIQVLEQLLADLAVEWQRVGTLPPEQHEKLASAGRLREMESVEGAAAYLLAWARLYRAMTLPAGDPQRAAQLDVVIDEAVGRRRWTEQPHEKTGMQVQALMLASIAQRLAGRFDRADASTQQAIRIYAQTTDPQRKQRIESWALLAVLERIRLLRDRGQAGDAAAAVDRAYEWAQKTRPGDAGAVIALAVLRRSLEAGPGVSATGDPLPALARARPEARPMVYTSVGRLLQERGGAEAADPFDKLSVAWAIADDTADYDQAARIARAVAESKADAFLASEGLFLLARCEAARARPTGAAGALIRLAREYPASDRAAAAIDEAVRLAAQGTATDAAANARRTLVNAVRLLRERSPQNARLPDATVAAGVALQQLGQWIEAAAEFALVPPQGERGADAAVRRVRCLTKAFEARPTADAADAVAQAAVEAQRRIESLPDGGDKPCRLAEIALLCAGIQADPAVRRFDEAVRTLDGFETRYAACPEWIAPVWRIRLTALEGLGRLAEANGLVERVVAAEPDRAGPVMVDLLARFRGEMDRLRDEGREDDVRRTAGEAARLAETLERWAMMCAVTRPTTASAPGAADARRRLGESARLARIAALLDAGRAEEACRLIEGRSPDERDDAEWRFVRAECLYRSGDYREALPVFHRVWQTAEEASPLWWRALLRNLQCHTEIGTDPDEILQAIRQRRHRHQDMGGPALLRQFDALQRKNEDRQSRREPR